MSKSSIFAVVITLFTALFAWNAQAAVIGFDPLNGPNGSAYTGHTENGFTVTPTQGNWFQAQVYGNPVPSIYGGPINSPTTSQIKVTGGIFKFFGVDVSSNTSAGTRVDVLAYLGGALQFGYSHTINVVNQFETLLNPGPFTVDIDTLFIALVPTDNVTSFNVDNIQLRASNDVPAPAVLGLMLIGLAGLGVARRKSR